MLYVKLQVPDGMSPTHSRSYDLSFLPRLLHTKFTAFGRLELELVAGVVWEENTIGLELELAAERSDSRINSVWLHLYGFKQACYISQYLQDTKNLHILIKFIYLLDVYIS